MVARLSETKLGAFVVCASFSSERVFKIKLENGFRSRQMFIYS